MAPMSQPPAFGRPVASTLGGTSWSLTIRVVTTPWGEPSPTAPASSSTGASVMNRSTVGEPTVRAWPLHVYGRFTARHGYPEIVGLPDNEAVYSLCSGPLISGLEVGTIVPFGSEVATVDEADNSPAQVILGIELAVAGIPKVGEACC